MKTHLLKIWTIRRSNCLEGTGTFPIQTKMTTLLSLSASRLTILLKDVMRMASDHHHLHLILVAILALQCLTPQLHFLRFLVLILLILLILLVFLHVGPSANSIVFWTTPCERLGRFKLGTLTVADIPQQDRSKRYDPLLRKSEAFSPTGQVSRLSRHTKQL